MEAMEMVIATTPATIVDEAAERIAQERREFTALLRAIRQHSKDAALAVAKALHSAVYFSIEAQDARPATELVNTLRASTKESAVIAVLEQYGNLAYMKSGKTKSFAYFDAGNTWDEEYRREVKEACRTWESFKPAPKAKAAFDLLAGLESLVKRANKADVDGEDIGHGHILDELRAIVGRETASDLDW